MQIGKEKSKLPVTEAAVAAIAMGAADPVKPGNPVKPDPKPVPVEPPETPFGKAFVALMSEEYCRDWAPCDAHVTKFFKRVAPKVEKLLG